nr:hypothetical protein [Mitsuaria sp. TWR114]
MRRIVAAGEDSGRRWGDWAIGRWRERRAPRRLRTPAAAAPAGDEGELHVLRLLQLPPEQPEGEPPLDRRRVPLLVNALHAEHLVAALVEHPHRAGASEEAQVGAVADAAALVAEVAVVQQRPDRVQVQQVGQRGQHHAAGRQQRRGVVQRGPGIGHVLEHVVEDDGVEVRLGQR